MPEDMQIVQAEVCEDPSQDKSKVLRIKQQMPAAIPQMAAMFRILADETRCKIVSALIGDELCVNEIAEIVGSSLSNVSHHLRLLRAERLVKYKKRQRHVYYTLDDLHVEILISQVLEHTSHR